ncbi:MAG: L-histidine N(alpha)-methyltransferase [Planctomycetes bacterium]|nr:L-histidine N(alpha)-methyltransferase [Planctomycetota bacterium]
MATTGYRVLAPQDLGKDLLARQFALDVLNGLQESPKRIPSRWFYDDEGSRIFQEICDLPEYYLTRAETEILERYAPAMMRRASGDALDVVDLGAGDGRKTGIVLQAALAHARDVQYVPIDISEGAMAGLVAQMGTQFPQLHISGIVGDYADALHYFSRGKTRPTLALFLGSNIGNFDYPAARLFLRDMWEGLNHGDLLLVGFDRKKDISRLLAAYADPKGVTARFDLNVLARINRELGGEFDLKRFDYHCVYNPVLGAIEAYLVSRERQSVRVAALGRAFEFEAWEPIHLEYSFKYNPTDVHHLARATGYEVVSEFTDSHEHFIDSLWRVRKHG